MVEEAIAGVDYLCLSIAGFPLDGPLVGHTWTGLRYVFSTGTQDDPYSGTLPGGVNVASCCGLVYRESERDEACMNPECWTQPARLQPLVACVSCERPVSGQHACSKCMLISCALCLGEDNTVCLICRKEPLPTNQAGCLSHSHLYVREDCVGFFGDAVRKHRDKQTPTPGIGTSL